MPGFGYGDWARVGAGISTQLFDYNALVPTSTANLGTDYTGAYTALLIWGINQEPTANVNITLNWQSQNAFAITPIQENIVFGPQQYGWYLTPVKGIAVQCILETDIAQTSLGMQLMVTGTANTLRPNLSGNNGQYLYQSVTPYGAASFATYVLKPWYEGPVLVTASSSAGNNAFVSMQYHDPFGSGWVEYCVISIQSDFASRPTLAYFPPAPVRLVISNNGAAQTIRLEVVPVPNQ